ncbi:MAG: hypothetical protein KGL39_37345 [Patescibacteria group bacterium]|nr:hypothetical protein [Patescibacteria group bacterium]
MASKSYKLSDFGPNKPVPGPWPNDVDIATLSHVPNDVGLLAMVRQQTALACLALSTNEADKDAIRRAFGILGPYQLCTRCGKHADHKGRCGCAAG